MAVWNPGMPGARSTMMECPWTSVADPMNPAQRPAIRVNRVSFMLCFRWVGCPGDGPQQDRIRGSCTPNRRRPRPFPQKWRQSESGGPIPSCEALPLCHRRPACDLPSGTGGTPVSLFPPALPARPPIVRQASRLSPPQHTGGTPVSQSTVTGPVRRAVPRRDSRSAAGSLHRASTSTDRRPSR